MKTLVTTALIAVLVFAAVGLISTVFILIVSFVDLVRIRKELRAARNELAELRAEIAETKEMQVK